MTYSPDHKRCLLEARLANHAPVAVNHQAGTLDEAFRVALDKLRRALDTTFGKLRDQRDRRSIRRAGEPDVIPEPPALPELPQPTSKPGPGPATHPS